jgi:hypothetical protein
MLYVALLPTADAKRLNSVIIILTMRSIWLERNAQVFGAASIQASRVLDYICEVWCLLLRARTVADNRL